MSDSPVAQRSAEQSGAKCFRVDGVTLLNPCHCGGTTFTTSRLLTYGSCKVVCCTQCGQMRTYPEPDPESLTRIYSDESEKYGTSRFEEEFRKNECKCFAEGMLSDIEAITPKKGRILDIGCNYGDFLREARAQGWMAEGLEINKGNARYLREAGFTIYDSYIEEGAIESDRFDAVMLSQVLEHIARPHEFLDAIQRVLKPGGLLYVGVPCFWSPIPLLLKRDKWYALVPEEHIWQFSVASLRRLLTQHNFQVVWTSRGCSGFWGSLSWRPRDIVRWTLYRLVDALRQGDFINMIAVNGKAG